MLSLIVRTYLIGFTMPLSNTRWTQTYKLTVNNQYTKLHNIQLIQETQLNQLTNECRHAPKRHDNSVLCPRTRAGPWQFLPHTDSSRHPRSRHFVPHDPDGHLSLGSLLLSSVLSSTPRLYKDGHPRYQSVLIV